MVSVKINYSKIHLFWHWMEENCHLTCMWSGHVPWCRQASKSLSFGSLLITKQLMTGLWEAVSFVSPHPRCSTSSHLHCTVNYFHWWFLFEDGCVFASHSLRRLCGGGSSRSGYASIWEHKPWSNNSWIRRELIAKVIRLLTVIYNILCIARRLKCRRTQSLICLYIIYIIKYKDLLQVSIAPVLFKRLLLFYYFLAQHNLRMPKVYITSYQSNIWKLCYFILKCLKRQWA